MYLTEQQTRLREGTLDFQKPWQTTVQTWSKRHANIWRFIQNIQCDERDNRILITQLRAEC